MLERYEIVCKEYMRKKKEVEKKEKIDEVPRKRHYWMRAHCNVLNDTPFPFPMNPQYCDWSLNFP